MKGKHKVERVGDPTLGDKLRVTEFTEYKLLPFCLCYFPFFLDKN